MLAASSWAAAIVGVGRRAGLPIKDIGWALVGGDSRCGVLDGGGSILSHDLEKRDTAVGVDATRGELSL